MTLAEQMASDFASILTMGGGQTLAINGTTLTGTVEVVAPESAAGFTSMPADMLRTRITVLTSALPAGVKRGHTFTDASGGKHRITAQEPQTGSPFSIFQCSTQ